MKGSYRRRHKITIYSKVLYPILFYLYKSSKASHYFFLLILSHKIFLNLPLNVVLVFGLPISHSLFNTMLLITFYMYLYKFSTTTHKYKLHFMRNIICYKIEVDDISKFHFDFICFLDILILTKDDILIG